MSLASVSIRRPVLAIVFSITIVLFGLLGFKSLGVREFPSIDAPVITVSTNYLGASADVIESQITEPLERAVNAVAGIRTLTSVSREGRSTITVEFELGADLERAANDVRDRVSAAVGRLPPDVEPPRIQKADSDSPPVLGITVQSNQRNLLELTRLADETFVERLQTIDDVAQVDVWGSRTFSMRLWIDPQRLAAYGLTLIDIRSALQRESVELPAGRIEGADVELTIRAEGRLDTPEAFSELILKQEGSRIVRLRDVGRAELGPRNDRTVLKREGIPMVAVVARPQPGANFVEIADEVKRRVAQITKEVPADITVGTFFDTSEYIEESILEVQQTILLAVLLVVLVIFAFLRDWRTTLVPLLVIPVSLIGTFFALWVLGFSINVLTLLGLVLAIGIVVDDAIVVLENIYAKIEAGMPPIAAGLLGTREIFFAVVSTTIALIAVLLPILFLGGLTGRLFREFGVTLSVAVAISSFVALTLTSMLASRILKKRERQPALYRATEPLFVALTAGYRRTLDLVLGRGWVAWAVIAGCLVAVAVLFPLIPQELAPLEDRSSLRFQVRAPEGVTFAYMDEYVDQLTAMVAEAVPETEREVILTVTSPGFGASSSVNSAFMRLILSHPSERQRSQSEIAADLTARLSGLTGARTVVVQEPTISVGRRGGLPISFVVQAPNMEKLKEALPRFMEAAGESPVFSFVDADLRFDKPELRLEIDRARARDLGVSALDVAQTLQLALSEQRLGYFVMDGKQFEVVGQVEREQRDETADLRNYFVRSNTGEPVLLDKVVKLREESSPPQLYRYSRYLSATVSADLAQGYALGDGIAEMERIAGETLDETFSTALSGISRDFAESSSSLGYIFALALVLVYLVLSAQFESFRDPFVIMLAVPLALAGALGGLWIFGKTLNIFSEIGMIMLIGLITKNGILIVEFANQRRDAGRSIDQAIREAAAARFRPVLMTSLSTILGTLPIALALGAGSESRVPMGIAIIGGMGLGTLLTLFVIPPVYRALATRERRVLSAEDAETLVRDEARGEISDQVAAAEISAG
ncbi:MAG: efflux RND transporter permease subunit [Thermoanaerobaculia bacterium]|nr:efflux RND transporter permease subunit [Thermoanaerobaculia bacterium]